MTFRSSVRRRRALGLTLAACSLLIVIPASASAQTDITSQTERSSAAVQPQDLRSPDARAAALGGAPPPARSDLRSPDARDAAVAAATPPVRIDLRSPDARDAALGPRAGRRRPQQPSRCNRPSSRSSTTAARRFRLSCRALRCSSRWQQSGSPRFTGGRDRGGAPRRTLPQLILRAGAEQSAPASYFRLTGRRRRDPQAGWRSPVPPGARRVSRFRASGRRGSGGSRRCAGLRRAPGRSRGWRAREPPCGPCAIRSPSARRDRAERHDFAWHRLP